MIELTNEQHTELMNLWHLAKSVHPMDKHKRLLYAVKYFVKDHPDISSTVAYKVLTRTIDGFDEMMSRKRRRKK